MSSCKRCIIVKSESWQELLPYQPVCYCWDVFHFVQGADGAKTWKIITSADIMQIENTAQPICIHHCNISHNHPACSENSKQSFSPCHCSHHMYIEPYHCQRAWVSWRVAAIPLRKIYTLTYPDGIIVSWTLLHFFSAVRIKVIECRPSHIWWLITNGMKIAKSQGTNHTKNEKFIPQIEVRQTVISK